MITPDEIIDGWRNKVMWLTLDEAVILMRHLGGFEHDEIIIRHGGARKIRLCDLRQYRDGQEYCINIRPVYFDGGPTSKKRYRGTLLTMIVDRMLAVSIEKGNSFVRATVKYACRKFSSSSTPLAKQAS